MKGKSTTDEGDEYQRGREGDKHRGVGGKGGINTRGFLTV